MKRVVLLAAACAAGLLAARCGGGDSSPASGGGLGIGGGAGDGGGAVIDGGGADGGPGASDGGGATGPRGRDDGGAGDGGGAPDGGGMDAGCSLGKPAAENDARVVLVSHGFTETPGVDGHIVRSLTLTPEGALRDDGMRLDVGVRVARLAFVPSGELALALGEDGELVSIRVAGAAHLSVVDRVTLPAAGYGELHVRPPTAVDAAAGAVAVVYVVGSNVDTTSGVSVVRLTCDGQLSVNPTAFYNVRLADSMALTADGRRAVLLGGQAVFEPVDTNDLRVLGLAEGGGWRESGVFDVFHDFVTAGRIGMSPDDRIVLVPNGSPFSEEGGQLLVLSFDGERLVERDRLRELPDCSEVLWAPDGKTALLTQAQPGRVVVLAAEDGTVSVVSRITGIGLADQMALVARGTLSGLVLLPSVDPSGGGNVAILRIEGPGRVRDAGQLELGDGSVNIPDAIAVSP